MKKQSLILMFAFLIVCLGLNAQKGSVNGKTLDENQKILPFVTVLVLKMNDSTIIKSTFSEENGIFKIDELPYGEYILKSSSVGYENNFVIIRIENESRNLGDISLKLAALSLNAVVVTATKPLFQVELDRISINVENTVLATGKNTLEVLAISPGLSIGGDESNIRFKGKGGVLVLIDDRQTYMSQSDVIKMLKSLPSSEVEKIELISNPPAKYDAAGVAGIINIKTIKNRNFGTKGEVQLGYRRGAYNKYETGGTLAHKGKHISINTNLNYFNGASEGTYKSNTQYFDNNIKSTAFELTNLRQFIFDGIMFRNSIDWNISKNFIVGSNFIFSNTYDKELKTGNTKIENSQFNLNVIDQNTNQITKTKTITANGYFKKILKGTNHELTGDIDFSSFSSNDIANIQNSLYKSENDNIKVFQNSQTFINTTPINTEILVGKLDYFKSIKKGLIEAGLKFSNVQTSNNAKFEEKLENNLILDPNRTFKFQYNENIAASYASYSRNEAKNNFKVGLRYEYTSAKGLSKQESSQFTKNYGQLFPSLFYGRNINEKNIIGLSYSRRISRPNYESLNPFLYIVDPFTIYTGNPNLNPSLSSSFEISHTYNNKVQTSIGYSKTKNSINEVATRSIENSNILIYKSINLDNFNNYNLSIYWPITITKKWEINNIFNVFYNSFNTINNGENVSVRLPSAYYSINNFISLKKGFKLEARWSYNSSSVYGLYKIKSLHTLDLGLKKTFNHDNTYFSLNISDVLWTNKTRTTSSFSQFSQNTSWQFDSRRITISLIHKFGKKTVEGGNERALSSDSERSRL